MWLRLLLDTIETRQGEGVAFLVEGVAFCIAGVAFFREVMQSGRSVFHFGVRVMQWGEACCSAGSDAFIVHDMGQGSVASGVHEMGTLYFHLPEKPVTDGGETVELQAAAAVSPSEKSSAG